MSALTPTPWTKSSLTFVRRLKAKTGDKLNGLPRICRWVFKECSVYTCSPQIVIRQQTDGLYWAICFCEFTILSRHLLSTRIIRDKGMHVFDVCLCIQLAMVAGVICPSLVETHTTLCPLRRAAWSGRWLFSFKGYLPKHGIKTSRLRLYVANVGRRLTMTALVRIHPVLL